jgi:hypothetical protein
MNKDVAKLEFQKYILENLEHVQNRLGVEKTQNIKNYILNTASYTDLKSMYFEMKDNRAEYRAYFKSILKKYGANSPEDLSDEKKKEFFNEVDAGWKSKSE